jgi:hypothetical protein
MGTQTKPSATAAMTVAPRLLTTVATAPALAAPNATAVDYVSGPAGGDLAGRAVAALVWS